MLYYKKIVQCSLIMTLCWFPVAGLQAQDLCLNSEQYKAQMEKQNYRAALQTLDQCVRLAEDKIASEDGREFNHLLTLLVSQTGLPLDDSYRNFQSLLSVYVLKELSFELATHFETHPEHDKKLFSQLRKPEEKFYFYYDTGRMLPHSRGIALTEQHLLWKNLTGDPQALAFQDISHLQLAYERGLSLSLTGWKLIVNGQEIRLSGVPERGVVTFVSALLYYINAHRDPQLPAIHLEVPHKEFAILSGWVTLCHQSFTGTDNPTEDLQTLDGCLQSYGKDFKLSQQDEQLLTNSVDQLLMTGQPGLEKGYAAFKTVLKTSFFADLKLHFQEDFVKADSELFAEVRQPEDSLYFYFDTGTMASGSRGVALTSANLIWKNLLPSNLTWKNFTAKAIALPFTEINSVTLLHSREISSIGGWKLRFNNKEELDIVLSKLSESNVKLFSTALVYFINQASGKSPIQLQISDEAKDVLTKSFLERHPQLKSFKDSVFGLFDKKPKAEESPTEAAPETTATETAPSTKAAPETTETAPSTEAAPETTETAPSTEAAPETTATETAPSTETAPETTATETAPSTEAAPETTATETAPSTEATPETTGNAPSTSN